MTDEITSKHQGPPSLAHQVPVDSRPGFEPDEDAWPQIKARAAAACGTDEVRTVAIAGIDHLYVMRAATRTEFDAYFNMAQSPEMALQAARSLASACLLWPERRVLNADEKRLPSVPHRLCDAIETWAGASKPVEEAVGSDPDEIGPLADREKLLLTQYREAGQLKRCVFQTTPLDFEEHDQNFVRLVVKRPPLGVYQAFMTSFQKGSDKAGACYDMAMSCIVEPNTTEGVRSVLASHPGIPVKLVDVLVTMAGAGQRISTGKR